MLRLLLLPFTILYWLVTSLRNLLFDWGIIPAARFPVPVICVGNITVGGTGKTPHIEYLARIVGRLGVEASVLSRGYKRKTAGFVLHIPGMQASEIGDEPAQIAQKFPELHVAACENRSNGIKQLLLQFPSLGCVLLDDAFQHRYVQPSLTILLTDISRPIWNDWVFPSGLMREGFYGRHRAHILIVTKCPSDLTQKEADQCRRMLSLKAWQRLFFSTITYGNLTDIRTGKESLFDGQFLVLTGIAQHEAFVSYIASKATVKSESHFPDHHQFTDKELHRILKKAAKRGYSIVTTEKDAVRLKGNALLADFMHLPVYYLPIRVEMLFDKTAEFERIVEQHILSFKS